jgi:phage tail-like protein
MPVPRENPYMQFNFVVDLGDGKGISAGFQEISGIGTEVPVTEYRNGNEQTNNVRKYNGLNKATDVTFKRGAIGTTQLYDWLDQIRTGANNGIRPRVTVKLLSEDHNPQNPVMTWHLLFARAIKITYGPFSGKGNEVAMEEMVLAYEEVVME